MALELRPHQVKAIGNMFNGCVLMGGVGTGKSITSLAYYYEKVCGGKRGTTHTMSNPRNLVIITTAKKRDELDWDTEALLFGLSRHMPNPQGVTLTIDSWNNVAKYTEVRDAFFIFDETRIVGSGAWVKAFLKITPHNQWVLLSATPGDTWLDYIPLFVAHGFYKNRTQFKREHVVYSSYAKFPKVERYLATGKLVRLRNSILVDMPYDRHTKRHHVTVEVDYDKTLYDKVVKDRWHVYEERPLRDVTEMFSVMRRVVNSDESRLTELRRVLEKHPKVIVFYNFNYELEMLRTVGTSMSLDTDTTKSTKSLSRLSPDLSSRQAKPNTLVGSSTMSGGLERCGTWTPDEGKGEMWIPCRDPRCPDRPSSGLPSSSSGSLKDCRRGESPSTMSEPPGDFAVAEWNGKKHEAIPKTGRWMYLVQYMAGAEGWNCIETDAVVFYSQTYSYRQYAQAQGRIDRLNTPFVDLHYYNLVSKSSIDIAVGRALKTKKNFNEKDLMAKF